MRISSENFGPFESVELDLDYRSGEPKRLVAVYGANGSGKTQLCRMLRFVTEITMTYDVQGLRSRHISYREVSKDIMRKGADKGVSVTYVFDVNGRSVTYILYFNENGELLYEQLHGDFGREDGFEYFQYNRVNSIEKQGLIGLQPRYCKSPEVNRILLENIDNHTMLSTLLIYPGMRHMVRDDLREVLDALDRIILPERYFGGPVGDWCCGSVHAWDVDRLKEREGAIADILRGADRTITGARYETFQREAGTVGAGIVDYYLVVSRMVGGKEVENSIHYESSGIRHLVNVLSETLPATSWRTAVVDDFDAHLGEALTMELMSQLSSQINGRLVVTLNKAEPLRNLDPRCVYIIDVDENGHRSVMTVSDRVITGRTNNNAARFRDGSLGGVPIMGCMNFDLVAERLKNSDRDVSEKD